MSIIIGEIDLCACRDQLASHDAFGCGRAGCTCTQTPEQLRALQAIRDSLDRIILK